MKSLKHYTGPMVFRSSLKIMACLFIAALVLLALGFQCVSAQGDEVQITNVDAPSTAGIGQPVTINVTITYVYEPLAYPPQSLIVWLQAHTETGPSYPLVSASSNCYAASGIPVCVAEINSNDYSGTFTCTLTVNAPNSSGLWQPSVIAAIITNTGTSYNELVATNRIVTINVSATPTPEFSDDTLLFFFALFSTTITLYLHRKPRL